MNERVRRAILRSATWSDLKRRVSRAEFREIVARARKGGFRSTRGFERLDPQIVEYLLAEAVPRTK